MAAEVSTPTKKTGRNKPFRRLLDNPVVLKELRSRMRGARAFIVLTVYLLLLGAFSSLIYVAVSESYTNASGQTTVGEIGRTLFGGVVAIEMLLVAFIAPAFTSGAISGEREHQTFDLLRTTLLPPYSFVVGKLLSAMLFVLLLLLAAIPLQASHFLWRCGRNGIILSFVILAATAAVQHDRDLFLGAIQPHPVGQRADLCVSDVHHVRPAHYSGCHPADREFLT
jgi:ABC-type Na+ efflux pump permease subunit